MIEDTLSEYSFAAMYCPRANWSFCTKSQLPSNDFVFTIDFVLRGSHSKGRLDPFIVRDEIRKSGEGGENEKRRKGVGAVVGCCCKDLAAEKLPVIAVAARRIHSNADL